MKSPLKGALGGPPGHHRAPEAQQGQRLVGAPWCLKVRAGVCSNGPNLDHGKLPSLRAGKAVAVGEKLVANAGRRPRRRASARARHPSRPPGIVHDTSATNRKIPTGIAVRGTIASIPALPENARGLDEIPRSTTSAPGSAPPCSAAADTLSVTSLLRSIIWSESAAAHTNGSAACPSSTWSKTSTRPSQGGRLGPGDSSEKQLIYLHQS